jgi:hypothetical protein
LLLGLAALPMAGLAQQPQTPDPVVDERTEAVIKGALKWLAAKQQVNGAWALSSEEQKHPLAITSYALLAFLTCGHLPGEGEYGKTVQAGMQCLLDSIGADGLIGNRDDGQYMYGHGIASITLAELYGQTRAPALRPRLERMIRVIIGSQNEEGGWRYRPVAREADISVTVLQVVALRAARNAGLDVPQATLDNAVKYVRKCQHAKSGGFTYMPGREPGFARTAAAIYSLQVCGLYEDEMVKRGSAYLVKTLEERDQWFTYGNFYAAPAQYMVGGDTWRRWYDQIKDRLLRHVVTQGQHCYWEPKLDGRQVGPVFATAVYTTILAMPYHYLPLYQR